MEKIAEDLKKVARSNVKLLLIQKLSGWLLFQPEKIDKDDLIKFLQSNINDEED